MSAAWLPPLLRLSDFDGDWARYEDAQYECFCRDFRDTQPSVFEPKRWAVKRHPMRNDREATFWHVTRCGPDEESRVLDITRCERIGWIRPMIDRYGTEHVRCWRNERSGKRNVLIAIPDFSYLVVLREHPEYVMLWTAYCIEQPHRRTKYEREWAENASAARESGTVAPSTSMVDELSIVLPERECPSSGG